MLEGLEAVRVRPGMYIGSTDQRGLHHLIYEILDNAVDEAMAGHCESVEVSIGADGLVMVTDNGRGIPVDEHPVTGKSALETVMTTLHAGGKFGGGAYKVTGGLHGVGGSVVNGLSEHLRAEVRREGRVYSQEYSEGIPTGNLETGERTDEHGTIISFRPDPKIFPDIDYDFEVLANHFKEIAYLNKGTGDTVRQLLARGAAPGRHRAHLLLRRRDRQPGAERQPEPTGHAAASLLLRKDGR